MLSLTACVTGFFLDMLFGDPTWFPHPVRAIGAWISFLERKLRNLCDRETGKTKERRLTAAGAVLWLMVAIPSMAVPYLLLILAGRVHPALKFCLESFWCYQLLAAKSLRQESHKVYLCLKKDDLSAARRAVSMIVGRDTQDLDTKGVTKAAVETVAENTSDGVVAPLCYLLLGGAPLGFFYKSVNTMDSMVGYKNETYRYLGRIPAKLDDLCNYIPARLSAWLMLAAAFLLKMDAGNAWGIYRRDRRKHASPNAAQTEAVCAGALDIQLAGDAVYFGQPVHKETIGDPRREPEAEDINRAGKLMYTTSVLGLALLGGVKFAVLCLA